MLFNDSLLLRKPSNEDLPFILSLRNDLELQSQLLTVAKGSDLNDCRVWLELLSKDNTKLFYMVTLAESLRPIGFIQLTEINYMHQRCRLGICLSKNERGKGQGKQILSLIIAYAKNYLNLRKIVLEVRSDNIIAQSCYKSCGFYDCGLLAKHFYCDGIFHDVKVMEILLTPN